MYKKILRLNKSAFLTTSPGQIINLIANDINKLGNLIEKKFFIKFLTSSLSLEMCMHFIPYPLVSGLSSDS